MSWITVFFFFFFFHQSNSLQLPKEISSFSEKLSRRDAILLGGGSILYGKIVADALSRVGSNFYPMEHEKRISSTFHRAIKESSYNLYGNNKDAAENMNRPFRILEVGIGDEYRTILNGSYDTALQAFFSNYPNNKIALTGLDLDLDSTQLNQNSKSRERFTKAKSYLQQHGNSDSVTFDILQGNICSFLPSIPDGYFDVVTCCLLLCSVSDQASAIQQIKRVLRSDGGAFGYLEHVAVDEGKDYDKESITKGDPRPTLWELKLLEKEQIFFDPAQQFLAHNCHLHRYTENAIWNEFNLSGGGAKLIESERFIVDKMWPVSCQARGVVVKS